MSLPYQYPTNATLIPFSDLDVSDRVRSDHGDIESLAESISDTSLIHPPTVVPHTDPDATRKYKLVAGGRRTRALLLLDSTELPVSILPSISESDLLELELIENYDRKSMTWQETCLCLYKIHTRKVHEQARLSAKWGQRQTGKLLGVSCAHVSHATQVAAKILAGDTEINECNTLRDAYVLLLKRVEEEAQRVKAQAFVIGNKPKPTAAPIPTPSSGINAFDGIDSIFSGGEKPPTPERVNPVIPTEVVAVTERIDIPLSDMILHGDCIEVMKTMASGYCDHVVTDIPYGIDMGNLSGNNIDSVAHTHDVDQNLSMMPLFLELSYKVMKDNGFCVFWYDMQHHEKLRDWAIEAGFKVQRWPLIWKKESNCQNNAAQFNYTKDYECAMVCRKGEAILNHAAQSSIVHADGSIERKLYSNPFSKPTKVWEFILSNIAREGQTVLDPFAGQMSSLRPIINMGMNPRAIELDEVHYNAGLIMVRELLTEKYGEGTTFS